jgi:hypothetical protein
MPRRGASSELPVHARKELAIICFFDCACCKDIVELLLLILVLFLIVSGTLLIEHFDNGLEVAMGYVVDLHLAFALELQGLKLLEKLFLTFSDCLDSMFE